MRDAQIPLEARLEDRIGLKLRRLRTTFSGRFFFAYMYILVIYFKINSKLKAISQTPDQKEPPNLIFMFTITRAFPKSNNPKVPISSNYISRSPSPYVP